MGSSISRAARGGIASKESQAKDSPTLSPNIRRSRAHVRLYQLVKNMFISFPPNDTILCHHGHGLSISQWMDVLKLGVAPQYMVSASLLFLMGAKEFTSLT